MVTYGLVMASITLKNIPESLHVAYRRRAKANAPVQNRVANDPGNSKIPTCAVAVNAAG